MSQFFLKNILWKASKQQIKSGHIYKLYGRVLLGSGRVGRRQQKMIFYVEGVRDMQDEDREMRDGDAL